MVTENNKLGVIDYQDALMATRCYDVVALLNDRDTDSALGMLLTPNLLEYFSVRIRRGPLLRGISAGSFAARS